MYAASDSQILCLASGITLQKDGPGEVRQAISPYAMGPLRIT